MIEKASKFNKLSKKEKIIKALGIIIATIEAVVLFQIAHYISADTMNNLVLDTNGICSCILTGIAAILAIIMFILASLKGNKSKLF